MEVWLYSTAPSRKFSYHQAWPRRVPKQNEHSITCLQCCCSPRRHGLIGLESPRRHGLIGLEALRGFEKVLVLRQKVLWFSRPPNQHFFNGRRTSQFSLAFRLTHKLLIHVRIFTYGVDLIARWRHGGIFVRPHRVNISDRVLLPRNRMWQPLNRKYYNSAI